jgi:hypothetical protein
MIAVAPSPPIRGAFVVPFHVDLAGHVPGEGFS